MKPEDKIKAAAQFIGTALDESLGDIGGERMGFVLLVAPLGREGFCPMISNLPVAEVQALCSRQALALIGATDGKRRMQ